MRTIHPFPARMAPELALEKLRELSGKSIVLDPMAGSGTVIRQATDLGHGAIGFDVDPLAVLMTNVWTTPVEQDALKTMFEEVKRRAASQDANEAKLGWIDDDEETSDFIKFWFGTEQRQSLRRISYALDSLKKEADASQETPALNAMRLALSRIIITKDRGASLARDVSHSRPHRVMKESDFSVMLAYDRSVKELCKRLQESPPTGGASTTLGDARCMSSVERNTVDAVVTSPPYLNAIDYMRGHRLSLVWLGHSLSDLRVIRSGSIGSERRPKQEATDADSVAVKVSMGALEGLPAKFDSMVGRYVQDIICTVGEIARVLKSGGRAVFVVGDSCLRGVFIRNSNAVESAAKLAGLRLVGRVERDLPTQSRYLPMTTEQLAKRMRTEAVLSFAAP